MQGNLSNLGKEKSIQISGAHTTPGREDQKRNPLHHIISKILNVQQKMERVKSHKKAGVSEQLLTFQSKP